MQTGSTHVWIDDQTCLDREIGPYGPVTAAADPTSRRFVETAYQGVLLVDLPD
jgi:hypothetical protein